MSLLLLSSRDYIDKLLSTANDNLIGLWLQNEAAGSVSKDYSKHGHDGAYTGVTLGAAGVPGTGMTAPTFDGTNDYNDIHSAGLANDNLLSNPGFETAGAGGADVWANWLETAGDGAIANEAVVIHEGSDAAKLTCNTPYATSIYQNFTVVSGKRYHLRFWGRDDGVTGNYIVIYDVDNAESIAVLVGPPSILGGAYAQKALEFTAPAGCTTARIVFYAPLVTAKILYVDACEVRCMDGFLGDEGTLLAWAKVSAAGVWSDSTVRYIAYVGVDASNLVAIGRTAANGTIGFDYEAGGTAEAQATGSLANIDYACYAMTWSKSGDSVDYYIAGAASGAADTGLGTWVGDLDSTLANVGAGATTPSAVWSGTIGPVALWNKALSADQIAHLSKI